MNRLTTIQEHIIPFYLFCHCDCIFFSIVLKFYSTVSSTFLFKCISTVLKIFFLLQYFIPLKLLTACCFYISKLLIFSLATLLNSHQL